MLNLNYATLINSYRHYAALPAAELLAHLGWSERADDAHYRHNGAVLTSLALLSCGAPLNGQLRIEAGLLRGRKVYGSANRLAGWLAERHQSPEIIECHDGGPDRIACRLFGRRGIVAFLPDTGSTGGEIAVIDSRNAANACRRGEARHPLTARFWEIT